MTTSKSQPLLFMILVIAEVMASTTSSTAGMCFYKNLNRLQAKILKAALAKVIETGVVHGQCQLLLGMK